MIICCMGVVWLCVVLSGLLIIGLMWILVECGKCCFNRRWFVLFEKGVLIYSLSGFWIGFIVMCVWNFEGRVSFGF